MVNIFNWFRETEDISEISKSDRIRLVDKYNRRAERLERESEEYNKDGFPNLAECTRNKAKKYRQKADELQNNSGEQKEIRNIGTYIIQVECRNCGNEYEIIIPKGMFVTEFLKNKECSKCGLKEISKK